MRRSNTALLVVYLMIMVALLCPAIAQEPKEIACIGKIVDTKGQPLKSAKVDLYIYWKGTNPFSHGISPTKQVTTGSDGSFSFHVLAESDTYAYGYVVARKKGFALGWASWNMRMGSAELEIELGQPNSLAGVVVDENDKPIPMAQVSISLLHKNKQYLARPFAPTLLSTNTDVDGTFTFTNLPLGTTADLMVEKTGYARINSGTASSQPRYTVGQGDIKLVLPIEARIEGIVVEKKTGRPTAGIRLIVKQQDSWVQDAFDSEDNGTFSVNSLAPGKYRLELLSPRAEITDWVAEPVEVVAEKGQTTSGVRIELVKGGVLEVVVTDAISGKPIENAGATVLNKRGSQSGYGLSDKDGVIRVRLMPGDYFLLNSVCKQGYSPQSGEEPFTIVDGKTEHREYTIFPESKPCLFRRALCR